MAKAEKITVELSRYDRQLLRQLIDAVGVKTEDAPAVEQTIKRLTEPAIEGSYIPSGEGDWQLQNDEKAGKDD